MLLQARQRELAELTLETPATFLGERRSSAAPAIGVTSHAVVVTDNVRQDFPE